ISPEKGEDGGQASSGREDARSRTVAEPFPRLRRKPDVPYVRSAPLKLGSSAAAGRGRHRHERLFADAETAEDEIENVVVSSRACDFVERTKCVVEIEQQHLVWNATVNGLFSRIQSVEGIANQRLMAGVGQESRFGGRN